MIYDGPQKEHASAYRRRSFGFSMIEVIFSVVLAAIIGLVFSGFLSSRTKRDQFREQLTQIEVARNRLRQDLSCSQTLEPVPTACDAGGPMTLKAADGSILINSDPDAAGNWFGNVHIKANCISFPQAGSGQKRIEILARLETAPSSNQAAKHTIKNTDFNWFELFQVPMCYPIEYVP